MGIQGHQGELRSKEYIFEHDYGERRKLLEFVLAASREFDSDTLVGFGVAVGNNIYDLRCYVFMHFEKDTERFEQWLTSKYPLWQPVPNTFTEDFILDMQSNGYNVMTFIEGQDDMIIEALSGFDGEFPHIFAWPSREEFNAAWHARDYRSLTGVFLCHSSLDKHLVDALFAELQSAGIRAWYDKYEISIGDDIVAKIEQGLEKCDCGIVILSRNSLRANWPMAERSFLTDESIRKRKKLFVLNVDLAHEDVPPLLRRLRYQRYDEPGALTNIARSVKAHLETSKQTST